MIATRPSPRWLLRSDGTQLFLASTPLFGADQSALVTRIRALRETRAPTFVLTLNVDQLISTCTDPTLRPLVSLSDLVTIDGAPIAAVGRVLGGPATCRNTGADMLPLVAANAADQRWRIVVCGGAPGAAAAAAANLRTRHPGADVQSVSVPVLDGASDPRGAVAVEALERARPDVVFLCLGFPLQEQWFAHWRATLPDAVYVGAGAAVDFAANRVRRAPRLVQRLGAEWCWRLALEPRRLARRYLVRGPRFIGIAARSIGDRYLRGCP
ncbi:WecB/TagA/CpsF family glycosyltransferase [Curtobacterium pusillum]|uniref:WecB/TagA/CpsF family glycosyltransferase n=1 Tax=Curtobacterium pusillum TaxID=69373 RepID=UPI0011AA8BC1|nr:WecB/TagA/CpsF family glycosyltransferase [Curtobacterium pusillum]